MTKASILTLLKLLVDEVLQLTPQVLGALRGPSQEGGVPGVCGEVLLHIPVRMHIKSIINVHVEGTEHMTV
jgi:hypothetical protein